MFNSIFHLPTIALLMMISNALQVNQASAQSIEFEWQQTASHKDRSLTQFNQYSLQGDFQALLLGFERRHYHPADNAGHDVANLQYLKVGVQYYSEINDVYALWPRLQVMAGYDHHISSDSLTYNPQLVAIRRLTEDISIVIGGGALIHTSENQYYPVFGLVWKPLEHSRWSGNLTVPQGDLAYQLYEHWFAEASLKWQTRYYNADRSFSNAAFMRSQDTLLSVGARLHLNANFRINGGVTYAFQREVRLYTTTGDRVTENPASGLGFRLAIAYHF